jgi:hypothetical protein
LSPTIVKSTDLLDIPLATSRARAVEKFLLGLANVHVTMEMVTNVSLRPVRVIATTERTV